MKMHFDMDTRQDAPLAALAGNHAAPRFDWHGLRSRMAAAYALSSVLDPAKPHESVVGGGSFDSRCARALTLYAAATRGGLEPVNPTALANGNSECGNDAVVAGEDSDGD